MSLPVRVALQAAFFGTLGLGAYALRRLTAAEPHPLLVSDFADIQEHCPNLAATLSQLGGMVDEDALRDMLVVMRRILVADRSSGPRAQWEISRDSAELLRLAKAACAKAPLSDDAYRASMRAQQDTLPQLQGQLDDLLHHHLLARGV